MKKIISLLLLIMLFTGCAKTEKKDINIVCTNYPQYDFVCQILGEEKENKGIKYLLDSGVDIHSYQASVDDIVSIKQCDLLLYVGGESEEWLEDVIKDEEVNKVKMMDYVNLIEEEHEHEHEEEHEEYDEHVWLSVKNAKKIVKGIKDALISIDEVNKETYEKNTNEYLTKLEELDLEYKTTIDNAKIKCLIFADRFPFAYLCKDYNLSYCAAFEGCSAETEADFDTVLLLSNKVKELNINYLIKLEGSTDELAITIEETAKKDLTILTLDSIQSVRIKQNKTYLSIMTSNLNVIKQATE